MTITSSAVSDDRQRWLDADIPPGEPLPAMSAVGHRLRLVATTDMDDSLSLTPGRWLPSLAVAPQGHQDIEEVFALLGEPVLVPGRAILMEAAQHAVADESLESIGEDVACDTEVVDELVEAAHAEECIAEDRGSSMNR